MATHRDLARALFLREIGALRRVRIRQSPATDRLLAPLLALLGAEVTVEHHHSPVYFAGQGGLPTYIYLGTSLEAVL